MQGKKKKLNPTPLAGLSKNWLSVVHQGQAPQGERKENREEGDKSYKRNRLVAKGLASPQRAEGGHLIEKKSPKFVPGDPVTINPVDFIVGKRRDSELLGEGSPPNKLKAIWNIIST